MCWCGESRSGLLTVDGFLMIWNDLCDTSMATTFWIFFKGARGESRIVPRSTDTALSEDGLLGNFLGPGSFTVPIL
jgi:hypothetical protein